MLVKNANINNGKLLLVFLIFVVVINLNGCSRKVVVEEGYYGLILNYGDYVEQVEGYAIIEKRLFAKHIIPIKINGEINLGDDSIIVHYSIIDPYLYFKKFGSSHLELQRQVVDKIVDTAVNEKILITPELVVGILTNITPTISVTKNE